MRGDIININQKDIYIGYQGLKLSGELEKGYNYNVEKNKVIRLCESWTFNKKSLKEILRKMRKVDAYEWYTLCYDYPCWYSGIVLNSQNKYEISVYAGGYIILSNKNETLHFILEKESDLFIEVCDCCE